MSLIATPKDLIANPEPPVGDVLSDVLRTIRLSGSLQFCIMPTGDWHTDATPSMALFGGPGTMPFHIVVEGGCWLKINGEELALEPGDIILFPFGTGHQLGVGSGSGRLVTPMRDLPQKPWRKVPVLSYGDDPRLVRLMCGYLQVVGIDFAPLREALPAFIHVRTRGLNDGDWLRATIRQIVAEVDRPQSGGLSMLERLTEIAFIELLRHQILASAPGATGWLAALADPPLARCLALIHNDPGRDWDVEALAGTTGLSRSSLAERFQQRLNTSPIRYLRHWRLYLASVDLSTTDRPIAAVAYDAGYGTEAAFSRAFSRTYQLPPAAWREARAQLRG